MKILYDDIREQGKPFLEDFLRELCGTPSTNETHNATYKCPFHNDTNASLCLYKDTNTFYCFGCGAGTDIFDAVQRAMPNMTHTDAIKYVKERYLNGTPGTSSFNGQIPKTDAKPKKEQEPKPVKDYTAFFKASTEALPLMKNTRGLSVETLKRYHIGYQANYAIRHEDGTADKGEVMIIPTSKNAYTARYLGEDKTMQRYYLPSGTSKQCFASVNVKRASEAERPLWILEGAIDALSLMDCKPYGDDGEVFACAINGATSTKIIEEELKNAPKKPICIIAMDDDTAGHTAADKLTQSLKALKVRSITVYPFTHFNDDGTAVKDANDALKANKEKLTDLIIETEAKAMNELTNTFLEGDEAIAFIESLPTREEIKAEREKNATDQERKLYDEMRRINTYEQYGKLRQEISKGITVTPTGFKYFDEIINGGLMEGLYLIGANSSAGKTALTLQIADYIAQSKPVLYISLEMGHAELLSRSISRLTFEISRSETRNLTNAENNFNIWAGKTTPTIEKAFNQYANQSALNMFVVVPQNIEDVTVERIENYLNEVEQFQEKPVVFIDYLQKIAPSVDNDKHTLYTTDKQNIDHIIHHLKEISRTKHIPIWTISSFNRASYGDDNGMASAKGSGEIEYSADVMMDMRYYGLDYLLREAQGKKTNKTPLSIAERTELTKNFTIEMDKRTGATLTDCRNIELRVLKNRNGKKGSVELRYWPMFHTFYDVALI